MIKEEGRRHLFMINKIKKNSKVLEKQCMVQKVEQHKSLMFSAAGNIRVSESIVLMCFCSPLVLGMGQNGNTCIVEEEKSCSFV